VEDADMTFSKADFPHLKWSVLMLLLVLVAGSAAIILSKNYVSQARVNQKTFQQRIIVAQSLLSAANEDRGNMQTYRVEYAALLNRNIIDNEQRLDWIEGLEKIRKLNRVLDFKYAITPQHVFIPPTPLINGNFDLNISDMTLRLELLHEGQLLDFFDTLRAESKGWFILDHCTIERNSEPEATAHLKAECHGGWLTLKNKNSK
jgi:hypothetical protein